MRILLYGAGKTGTTAVYYAYKNRLPGIRCAFEPPDFSRLDIPKHPALLIKSLAVMHHAREAHFFPYFEKKVLIVRHPFDRLVSYVLYAPNNGRGFYDDLKMENYIELLRRKLSSPDTVPFREIVERVNTYLPPIAGMHAPVNELEVIADTYPDFHLLRYEDFVDGKLEELNRYSGFDLPADPEISDERQKVVRSKDYGDWHKWFLPEDVKHFRSIYRSYLDRFGYDTILREAEPLDETMTVGYSIKVNNQGRRTRWLPEYVPGVVNITGEGKTYLQARRAYANQDYSCAEELVNTLLAVNPRIVGFHHLRSRILAKRGDHAGAIEALQKAIAILPDEYRFHDLLAHSLKQIGNKAQAAAAVETARKLQEAGNKSQSTADSVAANTRWPETISDKVKSFD